MLRRRRRSPRPAPAAWLRDPAAPAKLLEAAQQGQPEAQWQLGLEYLRGGAVVANVRLAAHWLRLAAAAPSPVAGLQLGGGGRGVGARAEYLLAVLTREGEGLCPCPSEYLLHLMRATKDKGAPSPALFELARLYARGMPQLGVPRDLASAIALLRRAASEAQQVGGASEHPVVGQGKGAADTVGKAAGELARLTGGLLGSGLASGGGSSARGFWRGHQEEEALISWVQWAAERGSPEALCQLASLSTQPKKAAQLFELASRQGHPEALYGLGRSLYEPAAFRAAGTAGRDCPQAAECLSLACRHWSAEISKLEVEQAAREQRWLCFLGGLDRQLEDLLSLGRVLRAWSLEASRRRRLLIRCIECCTLYARRSAWRHWSAAAAAAAAAGGAWGTTLLSPSRRRARAALLRAPAWASARTALSMARSLTGWRMVVARRHGTLPRAAAGRASIVAVSAFSARVQLAGGAPAELAAALRAWEEFVRRRKLGCRRLGEAIATVARRHGWWRDWRCRTKHIAGAAVLGRVLGRSVVPRQLAAGLWALERRREEVELEGLAAQQEALEARLLALRWEAERLQAQHAQSTGLLRRRVEDERRLNSIILEVESRRAEPSVAGIADLRPSLADRAALAAQCRAAASASASASAAAASAAASAAAHRSRVGGIGSSVAVGVVGDLEDIARGRFGGGLGGRVCGEWL